MTMALTSWMFCIASYYLRRFVATRTLRMRFDLLGRATLISALMLLSTCANSAVSLLDCKPITLATNSAAALDGGETAANPTARESSVTVNILVKNPLFVCWAGSHRAAGIIAALVLVVYVAAIPAVLLVWLWNDLSLRERLYLYRKHRVAAFLPPSQRTEQIMVVHSSPPDSELASFINPMRRSATMSTAPLHIALPNPSLVSREFRGISLSACEQAIVNPMRSARLGRLQNLNYGGCGGSAAGPSEGAADAATPSVPETVSADPMLQPMLSDYAPFAWYTKLVDLALLLALALLNSLIPRPASIGPIVAKAAVCCSLLLAATAHVLIMRPYAPEQAWKGWVRAVLLMDSAGCAMLNAAVSALDTGFGGAKLATSITVGSNMLFGACCVTLCVLLWQFGASVYTGESVSHLNALPLTPTILLDLTGAASDERREAVNTARDVARTQAMSFAVGASIGGGRGSGVRLLPRPPTTPRTRTTAPLSLPAQASCNVAEHEASLTLRHAVIPVQRRTGSRCSRMRRLARYAAALHASTGNTAATRDACTAVRDTLNLAIEAITRNGVATSQLEAEGVSSAVAGLTIALARHIDDTGIALAACEGLHVVASHTEMCESIPIGALQGLVNALRVHGATSPTISRAACSALAAAASSSATCVASIVDAGGIPALVTILRVRFPAGLAIADLEHFEEATGAACRALAEMSVQEAHVSQMAESSVVRALAGVLATAASTLTVKLPGNNCRQCSGLGVSDNEANRASAPPSTAEESNNGMVLPVQSPVITAAAYAAQAIANLAIEDDVLACFVEAGGVPSLVALLGAWLRSSHGLHDCGAIASADSTAASVLATRVVEAMCTLSTTASGASALFDAGAILVLLGIVTVVIEPGAARDSCKLHPFTHRHLPLLEATCWTLRGFLRQSNHLLELVQYGGALKFAALHTAFVTSECRVAEFVSEGLAQAIGSGADSSDIARRIEQHACALLKDLTGHVASSMKIA